MSKDRISEHAERLLLARKSGASTDLVTDAWPAITKAEAQEIAKQTLAKWGGEPCGYKLGYTSEAMRRQMNIDKPNFGVLTTDMNFGQNAPPPLIHPRVEPEIALKTSATIDFAPEGSEQIIDKIEAAFPSLEIVDTRYHDYIFKFEDNVADNSSSAGFVLGDAFDPQILVGEGLSVALTASNEAVIQGHTSAAMGDPLTALAWLCRELNSVGLVLPAGSIVLTGGLTKAPSVEKGAPITATFEGGGEVSFSWR